MTSERLDRYDADMLVEEDVSATCTYPIPIGVSLIRPSSEEFGELLRQDPVRAIEQLIVQIESADDKVSELIRMVEELAQNKEEWKALYLKMKKQRGSWYQLMLRHALTVSDLIILWHKAKDHPEQLNEAQIVSLLEEMKPLIQTIGTRFKLERALEEE